MAREPGRPGCALESARRGEPLLATASRVTRWLLIEQPGAWGREALIESRLEARIAQTLRSRSRRLKVRTLLIRRPRWHDADGVRRAYLSRSAETGGWIERIELPDPAALLDLDLSALDSTAPPGVGVPGPAEVRLVCTNGRHDPCCADLGRPVVRALHEEGLDEVWESSHVGGDRFAANLVFLPTGVYYGRVPPERAGDLIRDHRNGLLHLEHYRGRSCHQPLVQAAEVFLRTELGERGLDALHLVAARRTGPDIAEVVFERLGRHHLVVVRREPGDPEHLTCADHGEAHPWRYVLVGIEVVEGELPAP